MTKDNKEAIKRWQKVRFGMFIHWGLYALPARHEWIMMKEEIYPEIYEDKYFKHFDPKQYNPEKWAKDAKAAGMKYVVLTTRHHDGFCLFDSQYSNFTSTRTVSHRDFVAEYVSACRRAGLGVGLYYSLGDWRFGIPKESDSAENATAMVSQAHSQVKELMSNYGKIDILWYVPM